MYDIPMRVAFISSSVGASMGGAPLSEKALIRHLSKENTVAVLCPFDTYRPLRSEDIPSETVHLYHPMDVLAALLNPTHWLSQILSQADIVHLNGHWRWENYFLSRLCQRYRVPYILHPRGMLVESFRRRKLKKLFNLTIGYAIVRQAEAIIALSQYEAESFGPYRVDGDKVHVIPNGITFPEMKDSREEGQAPYFLYIGRIEARKNLQFLIHAFIDYRNRGGRCRLRMVGPSEHGYAEELGHTIRKFGMERAVFLESPSYGFAKFGLMKSAKAVIYPALDEAFGRVPFETLSVGSLPIVSRQSGAAEYLSRFLGWAFFETGDAKGLAESLLRAESLSEKDLQKVHEAQSWVRNELEWERIGAKVECLYQRINELTSLDRGRAFNFSVPNLT